MSRKRFKRYLTLLMAIGVVAIVAGGPGTFASFNAEVEHTGNTFATGTLLLHSTSGTTTCASESNSSNSNVTSPTGCTVLFNNVSIGTPASGTLHTAIPASSGAITSIVADLTGTSTIAPGDLIKVAQGSSYNDTFTATAAVTPGSNVTIPVVSATPNAGGYTTAATVTVQTYTQYASIQLKNAGTLDAKDIKFAIPSCTNAAQTTLTLGNASIGAGTYSSGGGTLTFDSPYAQYGAPSGATVTIGSDTLTLAAQLNPGATSVAVNGTTAAHTSTAVTYTPFVSGSGTLCNSLDFAIVETDSSYHHDSTNNALGCAYGASTDTAIGCTFSTSSSYTLGGGPSTDTALTLKSGASSNTTTELDNGQSRYFVIGVQTDVSSLTNSAQNQKATFAVKWHIDQK